MKTKAWLMAAIVCMMPVAASAHPKWILYDGENGTCNSASSSAYVSNSPQLATPLSMRNWLRTKSDYSGYNVYHYGSQLVIRLGYGKDHGFYYFSSMSLCKRYAKEDKYGSKSLNELR